MSDTFVHRRRYAQKSRFRELTAQGLRPVQVYRTMAAEGLLDHDPHCASRYRYLVRQKIRREARAALRHRQLDRLAGCVKRIKTGYSNQ